MGQESCNTVDSWLLTVGVQLLDGAINFPQIKVAREDVLTCDCCQSCQGLSTL